MRIDSKYMILVDVSRLDRKTKRWEVHSTSYPANDVPDMGERATGRPCLLGTIAWYGNWRQYVFEPEADTLFNDGCLEAIRKALKEANHQQRQKQKAEKVT